MTDALQKRAEALYNSLRTNEREREFSAAGCIVAELTISVELMEDRLAKLDKGSPN